MRMFCFLNRHPYYIPYVPETFVEWCFRSFICFLNDETVRDMLTSGYCAMVAWVSGIAIVTWSRYRCLLSRNMAHTQLSTPNILILVNEIDGLVQDCSISSALAMETLQSCTKLSIYSYVQLRFYLYTQCHFVMQTANSDWCNKNTCNGILLSLPRYTEQVAVHYGLYPA